MPTMITVNLPVKDLERSTGFFTALGFAINPQFGGEDDMECLVIADGISVMLLSEGSIHGRQQKRPRRRHEKCRGDPAVAR